MDSAGFKKSCYCIEEPELAELKCKMIFRLCCHRAENPPPYHETDFFIIKAED